MGAMKKERVITPPSKVVIRHLPSGLTKEEFLEVVNPLPDHNWFSFCDANTDYGALGFCRAYINFSNTADIYSFRDKFDGYVFVDGKGNESHAVVEYAPFQKLSWRDVSPKRKDVRMGTITTDPDYLQFLNALENPEPAILPGTEKMLEDMDLSDEEKTKTPLVEYIEQKRTEILRKLQNRTHYDKFNTRQLERLLKREERKEMLRVRRAERRRLRNEENFARKYGEYCKKIQEEDFDDDDDYDEYEDLPPPPSKLRGSSTKLDRGSRSSDAPPKVTSRRDRRALKRSLTDKDKPRRTEIEKRPRDRDGRPEKTLPKAERRPEPKKISVLKRKVDIPEPSTEVNSAKFAQNTSSEDGQESSKLAANNNADSNNIVDNDRSILKESVDNEAQSVDNETQSVDNEAQSVDNEAQSVDNEAQSVDNEAQSVDNEAHSVDNEAQSVDNEAQSVDNEVQILDPGGNKDEESNTAADTEKPEGNGLPVTDGSSSVDDEALQSEGRTSPTERGLSPANDRPSSVTHSSELQDEPPSPVMELPSFNDDLLIDSSPTINNTKYSLDDRTTHLTLFAESNDSLYNEQKDSCDEEEDEEKLSNEPNELSKTSDSTTNQDKLPEESSHPEDKPCNDAGATRSTSADNSGASDEVPKATESGDDSSKPSTDPRSDPRAVRKIRNKDRPAMQLYRPGQCRLSSARIKQEGGTSSTKDALSSHSSTPSPVMGGAVTDQSLNAKRSNDPQQQSSITKRNDGIQQQSESAKGVRGSIQQGKSKPESGGRGRGRFSRDEPPSAVRSSEGRWESGGLPKKRPSKTLEFTNQKHQRGGGGRGSDRGRGHFSHSRYDGGFEEETRGGTKSFTSAGDSASCGEADKSHASSSSSSGAATTPAATSETTGSASATKTSGKRYSRMRPAEK